MGGTMPPPRAWRRGTLFRVRLDAAIEALADWGEPAYRAAQLRQAVTRDLVSSWDEVSTLSRALRARLEEAVPFAELVLEETQHATDGTVKARFRTLDGFPLETVLMRHRRPAHGLRLVAVRLRARLHVLRDRRDGPGPGPDAAARSSSSSCGRRGSRGPTRRASATSC